MRPSGVKRLWTHPELAMPEEFCRMSYVLFRVDGDVGRVVATRVPDDRFVRVGDYVQDRLGFCRDALSYVTGRHDDVPPLFIRTDCGVGILSGRYHLSAGLGLYLHIHTRPVAAARLIHSGALEYDGNFWVSQELRELGGRPTAWDGRSYPALLEAWRGVAGAPATAFPTSADGDISLRDLRDGMAKLAAFAGCGVTFTTRREVGVAGVSPYTRVKCYRPLLLEGLLLCLFNEMGKRAAKGAGVCRLEMPSGGGSGLSMTLHYPLHPRETPETREMYDTIHSYLAGIGETWGLDLYAPTLLLPNRDPDGLHEVRIFLDWLLNPAARSTSDIKARLILARTEGAHRQPDGEATPESTDEIPFGADLG